MADNTDKDVFTQELNKLRSEVPGLPNHPFRAAEAYWSGVRTNTMLREAASTNINGLSVSLNPKVTDADLHNPSPEVMKIMAHNEAMRNAMANSRGLSRSSGFSKTGTARAQEQSGRWFSGFTPKTSMIGNINGPMGGDVYNAIPRFYDPLEYWDISGLPWNIADEGHRHKLHKWLRLYYATHYLVPILIDIFTRFPLVGMSIESPDPALTAIYEDLFLGQLNYEDFLVGLGREFWLCALPGERVQTADGFKVIEEVTPNDQVITHKGRLRDVEFTTERDYNGKIVALRPHYCLPLNYTEGHKVLTRRSDNPWVPIEEVTPNDYVFVPVDQSADGKEYVNVFDSLDRDEWIVWNPNVSFESLPASVKWTRSPSKYTSYMRRYMQSQKKRFPWLQEGDLIKRNRLYSQASPIPSVYALDDDLLWLFGLFAAEGNVSNSGASKVRTRLNLDANTVRWCLCNDEWNYAHRIVKIVENKFHLSATVREDKENHSLIVSVYNIGLAHWLHSLFGGGKENKHLPAWALRLNKEHTARLLEGYFAGDGGLTDTGRKRGFTHYKLTTSSLQAASQVEILIRRLGFTSVIDEHHSVTRRGKECLWWTVGVPSVQTKAFVEVLGYKNNDDDFWQSATEHPLFSEPDENGNGYWVKVLRSETFEYSGPVYCLNVKDDHSYVSSVAVHNCGEAFPLGSFDEDLGVWEHEELINPEDVVIDNFPLLDSQQLKIVPPDYLRRIAQTRSPAREWYMLQQNYEDLIPYLLKGEHIPISPVMLTQVANKLNNWDDHGTPILLRGLRTLLHEEKLLASQDAIAERLYSPFILAKLGIMDMGDGLPPWIPTPEELQSVRDDIDITMAADFRVLVHHFGLEMSSVFGREQMPRLGDDFDRIERRLMEVFGVNPSLLSAGTNSQPYASSALQAEFMNQMLRTFQKVLKDHFHFRASVVAEAQGHYAYERKGQSRVPIYEDVVSFDDDGNKIITRKHKLLVPELTMAVFDLRDEATERQYLMGLRAAGLPIPDGKLMIGISWKDDEYVDQYNRDIIKKTISQQRAKMDAYIALVVQGLPVPMDLKYEVESVLQGGTGPEAPPGGPPPGGPDGAGAPPGPPPGGAGGGPESTFGDQMPSPPPGLGPGPDMQPPGGGAPPMAPGGASGGGATVPQISNERRPGLTYNTRLAAPTSGQGYLGAWINRAGKELLISIGDNQDKKEILADAKRQYPEYTVRVKKDCDAPTGSEWAMIDLIGGIIALWPEGVQKRAHQIKESIDKYGWFYEEPEDEKTAATLEENDEDPENPQSWRLKANQKIATENGKYVIIENNKKRSRVDLGEPQKKYSIIDTLYDGEYDKLRDQELKDAVSSTESPGQVAGS